jgi:hypothetical protein
VSRKQAYNMKQQYSKFTHKSLQQKEVISVFGAISQSTLLGRNVCLVTTTATPLPLSNFETEYELL